MNNPSAGTVHEEDSFTDDIGTLVFESALIQYLADGDRKDQAAFEQFIEAHVTDDDFLDVLCEQYPEFGKILHAEMALVKEEFEALDLDDHQVGNSQLA